MQIIFHIGQQKTASSTIQKFLAHNRKELAAQKVLYPRALGEAKANLITDLVTNKLSLAAARETILANLRAEFSGNYTRALLSNENLFGGKKTPRLMKEMFEQYATSWRVLCYLRRPDEHVVSQYQQGVKGPYVGTFDSFLEGKLHSDYYHYAQRVERWARVFGKDAVEVRVFHRKTLRGSPIEDFTQWVGLDPEGLSFEAEGAVNESLDRLNTEILRFLHLCQVEQPDLLQNHNTKRVLGRLRALDTGERLRLDTERAKHLQEQFRQDHERLAKHYLSPEHAAVLLASPADVPLPPPLNRDALFQRMMALFNDADLARLVVERAEQPAHVRKIPKPPSKREAKIGRIAEKQDREVRKQARLAAMSQEKRSKVEARQAEKKASKTAL